MVETFMQSKDGVRTCQDLNIEEDQQNLEAFSRVP